MCGLTDRCPFEYSIYRRSACAVVGGVAASLTDFDVYFSSTQPRAIRCGRNFTAGCCALRLPNALDDGMIPFHLDGIATLLSRFRVGRSASSGPTSFYTLIHARRNSVNAVFPFFRHRQRTIFSRQCRCRWSTPCEILRLSFFARCSLGRHQMRLFERGGAFFVGYVKKSIDFRVFLHRFYCPAQRSAYI